MGTSGLATPVDVSHRIVESDTAQGIGSSLRDGKERIRMPSGSESWAAAMALKSITGGEQCIGLQPGQSLSWDVHFTFDMPEVGSVLGNEVEVSCLMWRVLVRMGVVGVYERFVVSENVELSAFHEVSEMFKGQIYS